MQNKFKVYPLMLPTTDVDTPLYMSMGHKLCNWANPSSVDYYCHLYFVSDKEITDDDLKVARVVYNETAKVIVTLRLTDWGTLESNRKNRQGYKLVMATTDPSLDLPFIPQSFINRWVDEKGNTKHVFLEPSCYPDQPGWNIAGEVIIVPTKEMWNREEVKQVFKNYINLKLSDGRPFDEWFDKNYPS